MRRRILRAAPLVLATPVVAALACTPDAPPPKATPAATVQHAVTESQLTTVTLTLEAVRRLGIETAVVDSTTVPPTRTVGGEVVVPPGQTLVVSAPVAGTVLAPEGGSIPAAGSRVAARQPLMRLVALPPDRDLLRTQPDFVAAESRLTIARTEAERVAKLFADRLVSARDNERAQAELATARAAYDAALAQRNLVRGGTPNDPGALTPLMIAAPDEGLVRTLSVGPGQVVAAGTPLAEIIRLDRLWVRVAVYAGDAARFSRTAQVTVHALAGAAHGPTFRAAPVAAPPSADASAASVDMFYELAGATVLRPGERVGVTIPLAGQAQRSLAVPLTAIVRDMSGGSWVYERTDSVSFVRRRVEVARVVGAMAVLSAGPKLGSKIVTAGAAELFGTEFGAGK